MVFDQSVRGLAEGAAIDLLGIEIGTVTLDRAALRRRSASAFRSRWSPTSSRCAWARFGTRCSARRRRPAAGDAAVLQQLVANGLRAQLRTGNLLTGQLYVALDFLGKEPGAAPC